MSLAAGTVISHYRVERRLGAGGMGEVYLAHDLQLHRAVAIKLLSAPEDATARRRLLQEARAAAALDHPLICAVYEVGTDPVSGDYIAMQFVDGQVLSDRLAARRMSPAEALTTCRQIAEALRAAHRAGIIHRDLKPHNIIVTPGGDVKLLDFGIAKRVVTTQAAAEMATVSLLTNPDALIGTPAYMAPELLRNQPADFRSDIFALGCIAYECLTGRRAFSGETTADVLGQVMQVDPPLPSAVVPGLGPAYDALCVRMLKKAPAERFQSADEVIGALHALQPTSTRAASPSEMVAIGRWPPRRRSLLAAFGVIVAIALGVWWWSQRHVSPAPASDAVAFFEKGVEALRQGTYIAARSLLEEAIGIDKNFAQAWSRLAEVYGQLDNEAKTKDALLQVTILVPNTNALPIEERLRFAAVRFAVIHDNTAAVDAYQQLAEMHPSDPHGWIDLGLADESAGRNAAALGNYQKAVALDPRYAAAQLRFGAVPNAEPRKALEALDESARLYALAANTEGETEALLQKAILLARQPTEAQELLARIVVLTQDAKYVSQRVRAQFELTRVMAALGRLKEAEALGREAFDEAKSNGLEGIAVNGLIDLAGALINARKFDEADEHLKTAIGLAKDLKARRTENRALLQRAALLLATGEPEKGLAISDEPMKFFKDGNYERQQAFARSIRSRAYENLHNYDEAARIATEDLAQGERLGDSTAIGNALENLAGQMTKQGRLPDALSYRERLEKMHEIAKLHTSLKRDLTNRAELLIQLGRGAEAEQVLQEVERRVQAIAESKEMEAYADRPPRIALQRTLRAAADQRFADMLNYSSAAGAADATAATGTAARVLQAFARAKLGQSRDTPDLLLSLPRDKGNLVPDLAYWIAQALLARGDAGKSFQLASDALVAPGVDKNFELCWRLETVAAMAASKVNPADAAGMSARARVHLDSLKTAWGDQAAGYLGRPDIKSLLRVLSQS